MFEIIEKEAFILHLYWHDFQNMNEHYYLKKTEGINKFEENENVRNIYLKNNFD
jgi:hypothetical protein